MLPQRQIFPFRDREVFIRIFSWHHYAATQAELPFQGVRRLLFKSFPGTTMLPQRQSFPFRDRDVYYSNLFQPPLSCHTGRDPHTGSETFVIQIFSRHHYAATNKEIPCQGQRRLFFSRRHYAATKAEFQFQGQIYLLFESFPGATMPPQRQSSPFVGIETFVF